MLRIVFDLTTNELVTLPRNVTATYIDELMPHTITASPVAGVAATFSMRLSLKWIESKFEIVEAQ